MLVGNDVVSMSYVKIKGRSAEQVGMEFKLAHFSESINQKELIDKIKKLKQPVRKDNLGRGKGHVQGRIYTSLNKLLKAKTISQLA